MREELSIDFVARACGGQLKGTTMVETLFNGVSSDSRNVRPGEIFVALRGERYDGHDFLLQAAERGAAAAIVSDRQKVPTEFKLPIIEVDDTLDALQRFAKTYRKLMPLRTVAVTGSNGKTSTKEMLAALLAERFETIKSEGNLNNHIGVPICLLRIRAFHEAGVFELAMNHPGELAPLADMIAPEIGIITNIGPAHLEGLGDEKTVAREKSALIEALPATGVAVLNADSPWLTYLRGRTRARIITAGFSPEADVRAENVQRWENGVMFDLVVPSLELPNWPTVAKTRRSIHEESGPVTIKLRVVGDHWISNALLAAATARIFGHTKEEIARGFEKIELPAMRMQVSMVEDVRWINDAYNANPASMRAALRALAQWPCRGKRVAVLGDMLELGPASADWHCQIGQEAAGVGLGLLITVGTQARLIAEAAQARGLAAASVVSCTTVEQAAAVLRERVQGGDCVLVKGSRGMKLEPLVPRSRQQVSG